MKFTEAQKQEFIKKITALADEMQAYAVWNEDEGNHDFITFYDVGQTLRAAAENADYLNVAD